MKVFAVSGDKAWYKIGETFKDAKWFGRSPAVASILDTIAKGDSVKFTSTKDSAGKDMLATIIKEVEEGGKIASNRGPKVGGESAFRTPEEITKHEIGKMVAQTMTVFTGSLDINNLQIVKASIQELFKTYEELTKV